MFLGKERVFLEVRSIEGPRRTRSRGTATLRASLRQNRAFLADAGDGTEQESARPTRPHQRLPRRRYVGERCLFLEIKSAPVKYKTPHEPPTPGVPGG